MQGFSFSFAVLVVLLATPASAEWRRITSPNFIVVGDASARELREVDARFEGFHETLRRVLPAATMRTPVPTVVVVFQDDKAFTPFKLRYQGKPQNIAGYASGGQDVNTIAMLNLRDFSDRVIFHEYTHMVVANAFNRAPAWLNEGLAEFYSTFELTSGRQATIGRPVPEHLALLDGSPRIPIAELIKVDQRSPLYNEGNRKSDFYAESWALTHMLFNGQPSRVNELSTYLQKVNAGSSELQAWEEVFGTQRTESDLRRYLTRPTFGTIVVTFTEKIASLPTTDTRLSAADTAGFLALLQFRIDPVAAIARLESALKKEPDNVLANAALAQIEVELQRLGSAMTRLTSLEGSSDWFATYKAAVTLVEAAQYARGMDGLNDALAKAARWLEAVRKERPELPHALASLVKIELTKGGPPAPAAREYILRARALAPGRIDYVLMHAQLLADAGDLAGARNVVGPLATSTYPEGVRNAARRLLAGLTEIERAASLPPPESSRSVEVPDGNAGRPAGNRGGRFIPDYRKTAAGEQRVEGMLERIDCPAGRRVQFVVREASGLTRLEVARLSDVDFITYRNDLTGGVNCGPLKEPMHVFVTWKSGASASERTVVAVEFLPKN